MKLTPPTTPVDYHGAPVTMKTKISECAELDAIDHLMTLQIEWMKRTQYVNNTRGVRDAIAKMFDQRLTIIEGRV